MALLAVGDQLQDDADYHGDRSYCDTDEPLLGSEAEVGVHSEGFSREGDKEELKGNDSANDDEEERVSGDALEDVELLMQFSRVEEVKDLHHDEGVEDEGEVP